MRSEELANNEYRPQAASLRVQHVFGLDALRFVAALWVVFSHIGPAPVFTSLDRQQSIGFLLQGAWGILYSGPAAVIVFFVISGFCIHVPYAGNEEFRLAPYLVRRYVRIGIPMAAAMILTGMSGIDAFGFFDAVLWSLVAELMYYTLYPVIRSSSNRFGIDIVVGAAFVLSLLVVLTDPSAKGYGVYGWKLNWLLGLPCWMLGVKLAQTWRRGRITAAAISDSSIWKWRLLVWASSSVCLALNFHSSIGYPWTLNAFAIVAYWWIALEIRRGNSGQPSWKFLETAGRWSYSLYLCHVFAGRLYSELAPSLQEQSPMLDWLCKIAFVLAISYAFFVLVERPAHLLARRAARLAVLQPARA